MARRCAGVFAGLLVIFQPLACPVLRLGDRRYSGFVIAGLPGWPLSDDHQDYIPRPAQVAARSGPARGPGHPVPLLDTELSGRQVWLLLGEQGLPGRLRS